MRGRAVAQHRQSVREHGVLHNDQALWHVAILRGFAEPDRLRVGQRGVAIG